MTIAELVVKLNADPSGLERGMSAAVRTANRFASTMQSVGRSLSVAVTAPLAVAGAAAVSAAADYDSLRRGMIAVTGSAALARVQLDRMKDVARLPGLGFREAIQGSIRLQAVGISAQNSERYLRAFGNAVATTGGGKNELDRITFQLGQLSAKSKVLSQDIRPIIEAAPAVGRAMQQAFNTTDTEAIQRSGITVGDFLNRLVGQLERLSPVTGGAKNAFENFTDSLYRARVAIGERLLPAVMPLVDGLARMLERVNNLNPETVRWGIAIAGVAAVAGPLLIVIGSLVSGVASLAAALGTGLLPIIAVGGPLLIGLGALSAFWFKNKLDALNAAGAVDRFKASLVGLSESALSAQLAELQLNLAGIHGQERALIASGRAFRAPPFMQRKLFAPDAAVETEAMRRLGAAANETGAQVAAVKQALQTVRATAASGIPPLNLAGATGGADKLAGTLDRVGDELRHLQNLAQFQGVIREEDLTEPFQRQLSLVDELGNRVDTLSDQLSRLGSRAPSEAFTWLQRLRAELASQTELLKQQAQAWNALWEARNAPGGLAISTVANAPATQGRDMGAEFGGSGRLLGDLGTNLTLAGRALGAFREAVYQASRTLTEAFVNAAGRAGEFAGNFATVTQRLVQSGTSLAQAAPQALGFASAMEVANSMFTALQPALEALTLPLRIVGEVLSLLIIPVLRLLFPVFKAVAIVASFLGETIARIVAVMLNAIGSFVKAIGKVINAIVPFANPGNPLVKAGEAMKKTADSFSKSADEMAKKRKELQGLSFDDALNKTSQAADRLTEALINTVEGFKVEKLRFAALGVTGTGGTFAPVPVPVPVPPSGEPGGTGAGTGRGPFQPSATINFNFTGPDAYESWKRGFSADARRNPRMYALAVQMGVI